MFEKPEIGWKMDNWKEKPMSTAIYMPCETTCVSDEDQQIYREIFNTIDVNKDGSIRMKELKRFLSSDSSDKFPKGICTMILKMADRNKDGIISFDEFLRLCEWTPAGEIITKSYFQRCTELVSVPIKSHFLPKSEFTYEYQLMRYKSVPLLILSVCAVQLLFYINDQIHIKITLNNSNTTSATFSKLSSVMLFNNDRKAELWRFLTYLFVQKDIYHISSNIVMQILMGLPLEAGHGCWRVLGVFLTSVAAGSMSIAALSSNCVALVGASAGAYGLFGAHFSTIILNWREMQYRALRLFILVIFVSVDIFLWVSNPINSLGNSTITHISGFVIGFLVGVLLLRNIQVRSWETRLRLICLGFYVIIMLIQISFILFIPNFDIHRL